MLLFNKHNIIIIIIVVRIIPSDEVYYCYIQPYEVSKYGEASEWSHRERSFQIIILRNVLNVWFFLLLFFMALLSVWRNINISIILVRVLLHRPLKFGLRLSQAKK